MYNSLNNVVSPAWCRARVKAIVQLLEELPSSDSDRPLLRNGVIPEKLSKRFLDLLDYEYKLSFALNEPLTFTELCSFNTWFVLHPDKVCGKEIITSSRDFPVKIEGSKEDIIRTIRASLDSKNENPVELSLLELEALALETELQMLTI